MTAKRTKRTYIVREYTDTRSRTHSFVNDAALAIKLLRRLPVGSFIYEAIGDTDTGYTVTCLFNLTSDGVERSQSPWSFKTDSLATI